MHNLFQMMTQLRHELRDKAAARAKEFDLVEYLNRGHVEVARETSCITREVFVRAATGVNKIPLAQVLDDYQAMRRVAWRDVPLDELNDTDRKNLLQSAYQHSNSTDLQAWSVLDGNLILYPPPSVTEYTGATVTVTKDSATVTVTAGTPVASGVKKGWLFGIGASPTKWYAVRRVVSEVEIELQDPYREASSAGNASVLSSGAIRLAYVARPRQLRLVLNNATRLPYYSYGKATVINGSTTVTLVAPASLDATFRGYMEFALGTSGGDTRPSPDEWYAVRYRTSTTVFELWKPYGLATVGGAGTDYLLTDASPFADIGHPDWSEPAIFYAAHLAWNGTEGGGANAATALARYREELAKVKKAYGEEHGKKTQAHSRIQLPAHAFFDRRSNTRGRRW